MESNLEIVNKFFAAYMKRDVSGIRQVMADDVSWTFLGRHRLAGIKNGVEEVIAFFDRMGEIMSTSKPTIRKFIVAENDDYVVECQHIRTNREDGINIEHDVCVLWTIKGGKIVAGRHFFADPEAVDEYFDAVTAKDAG